ELHTGHIFHLAFSDVPRGDLEHRHELRRIGPLPRAVHHPGTHHTAAAAAAERLAASFELARGDVVRESHDAAVFHYADKQTPPDVASGQAKHLAEADAAMLLGKLGEERLEVGAERNRHG